MYLPQKDSLFQKKKHRSSPYLIAFLIALIIFMLIILRDQDEGSITPLLMATPTATRTVDSYVQEAEVHFVAGDLTKTLEAFQRAAEVDPSNVDLWVELARVQIYSSASLVTAEDTAARLYEALDSINRALELEPENSTAHAVKSFALDWLASPLYVGDQWVQMLTQAEQSAVAALQLDSNNTLALAYYAEILVDQLKWTQAEQNIDEALLRDDSLMDAYRINGYLQESLGNYSAAITNYKKAAEINPSLTFLYLSMRSPFSLRSPGPIDRTFPFCGFSFAVSGRTIPDAVTSSRSMGSTTKRLPKGLILSAIQNPPIFFESSF